MTRAIEVPRGLKPEEFKKWFQNLGMKCANEFYTQRRDKVEWDYQVCAYAVDVAEAITGPMQRNEEGPVFTEQWKGILQAFITAVTKSTEWKESEAHIL